MIFRAAILLACASLLCSYASGARVIRILKNGVLTIEDRGKLVELTISNRNGQMRSILRTKNPGVPTKPLVLDANCGPNVVCVKSGNVTYATITSSSASEEISIWRGLNNTEAELIDCFELGDGVQWFGGPQLRYQQWPIQNMYFEEEPYLPTHPTNMAVAERYWLSGKGIYIYANHKSPLFLDQNNYQAGYLCLIAKNKAPYRRRPTVELLYNIGVSTDPKTAHQLAVLRHLGSPRGIPDTRMVRSPIWSTWARYKANVSEEVVEEFADEIVSHGFSNSQLEIDDNWETCYGSAVFDTKKFPNITNLVNRLKRKGFRVTLWIHPFINEGCEPAYSYALNNSYFAKSIDGKVQTSWWQGTRAAVIDFTNSNALTWWIGRLKELQKKGIDSFKFDAGEVSWLPQVASLSGYPEDQPGIFTAYYAVSVANHFNNLIEVRVGWGTQVLPIFVRMIDKDTKWTMNNGLPTLITTLLQMNMNGYVHVLPDMIGGNGYLNGMLNGTEYPPKEMFIRWLQTNVFMPSLQYSFVPWDYDNETIAISKKFTDLHERFGPIISGAMNIAVRNGTPVNPPIWWVDPTNVEAQKISDEFLLGDYLLVAPVIQEDAVSRDVYLPAGQWRDGNTNQNYTGPLWLRNYPAPLDTLPYFFKQ